MATDLERLVVSLEANLKRYENNMKRAAQTSDRTARQIETRFKTTEKRLSTFGAGLRTGGLARALGPLAAALGTREIVRYADAWTEARNKIAAASQISGRQARSLEDINKLAQETRTSITATADLYAKLLRSTADVAKSEEEVAKATVIVNKAFKAGGAAASEQAAGILQLSQALGSGLLQGDELRSIRENAPLLAQAIAKEFGVTVGELKELGAQGELAIDRVFKAILKGERDIEAAFSKTNATVSDGFIRLSNSFTQFIGSLDKASQFSVRLGNDLQTLAGIFTFLSDALSKPQATLEGLGKRMADVQAQLDEARQMATSEIPAIRKAAEERIKAIEATIAALNKETAAVKANNAANADSAAAARRGLRPARGANAPATVDPKFIDLLTDEFVKSIRQAESGGRNTARNPRSSAFGAGQFIDSTWLEQFRKEFPEQARAMTNKAILALRANGEITDRLIKAYAAENAAVLQKAGVSVDQAALHLAHFLGAGDAAKVLTAARGTPLKGLVSDASIAANPTILGGGRTVEDAIAYANRRAAATLPARDDADEHLKAFREEQERVNEIMKEGRGVVEATATATERYAAELERLEGLLAAGAISQETFLRAVAAARQALADEAAKTDDVKQAFEDLGEIGRDAIDSIGDALEDGKITGKEFADILSNIRSQLIDMITKGIGQSIFGAPGQGRGPFGSLLGGLFGIGNPATGGSSGLFGFSKGGVTNKPAIFGEGGPEAAVPLPDGRSIPVDLRMPSIPDLSRLGGRQEVDVRIGVDASSDFETRIVQQSVRRADRNAARGDAATLRTAEKKAPARMSRYEALGT